MPLILGLMIAAVWLSIILTGFDLGIIARRGNQFLVILRQIFSPDVFAVKAATFTQFGLEPESVNILSIFDGRWWQALWHTMSHSFAPKGRLVYGLSHLRKHLLYKKGFKLH